MPGDLHILMTGGGAPGAAGILRCLSEEKTFAVHVADADAEAVGKYLHPHFHHIPFAQAPLFTETILELCRKQNIRVILPLVTKELLPFALHQPEFEAAGVKLLVSPAASLDIANNKSRLYEFLQWRGIAVPAFRIVETIDQFKSALDELGIANQPVCFKPSVSNGSRGFRVVTAQLNELDLLFNHKPNHVFTRPDDAIRVLSTGAFPELLVSEYLPGDEYSVDCLANQGETVLAVPRLRKKMINGISVAGEFRKEESVINYCRSIIKELKLHGNIGIQVKKSVSGAFLLLEINPRVQGTISAGLGAGINLPVLAVKQELGLPIGEQELQVNWGTRFSRYWEEVFY